MTGPLHRFGHFVARHALPVLALWLVFTAAVVLLADASGRPTSDDTTIPGSDSTRATELLQRKLPAQANGSVPIVVEAAQGKVTDAANKRAIERTVDRLRSNPHVRKVIDPFSSRGAGEVSRDGTIASIPVFLGPGPGDLTDEEADDVFADGKPARDAGLEVSAGGYLGNQLSQPSTRLSEIVGVGAAMVVLVLVLGTVAAMLAPILTALVGVFSGLAVVGVVGALIVVPSLAPTLGIMLGLGVGVDYSLFIVSRYRRLLEDGHDVREAVARATATSGGAVVFAGGTVLLSLLCLYFGGIPQVRALGYSAAIAVAVVIAAALTLLPALLAVLGRRIDLVRLRSVAAEERPGAARPSAWARWAGWVGRHPLPAALAGVVLLCLLALPLTRIELGAPDTGQMPESTTARQAYDALRSGFGAGSNGPLLVAVDLRPPAQPDTKKLDQLEAQLRQQEQEGQEQIAGLTAQLEAEGVPPAEAQQQATEQVQAQGPTEKQQEQLQQEEAFYKSPASDPRLVKLQNRIGKAGDVDTVSPAQLNQDGTAAAFTAVSKSAPSAERTRELVRHLRASVIPGALAETQLRAYVGGTTAANIDLADKIGARLPLVIAIIVALSFLLLTLAFRTLVVPALAAACNLLAVAAAYGVLVGIFQEGWGVTLIGLDHAIPVVSYVPLLMFAILFGLSTDYTVFLLTRVAEEYEAGGDHRRAIIAGLARSIRVIVAAAAIMVLVFASFILSGDPTVKQFGVGLAAAVAVDALIVCLVLPALMLLVGRATWWLPRRLASWLPRLGIEGEAYFAEHDSAAAASAKPAAAP